MSSRRPIFSCFFQKIKQLIIVTWPILSDFIEIGYPANSKEIITNPGRVITVFLIICKLGLSHALTCLSTVSKEILAKKLTHTLQKESLSTINCLEGKRFLWACTSYTLIQNSKKYNFTILLKYSTIWILSTRLDHSQISRLTPH